MAKLVGGKLPQVLLDQLGGQTISTHNGKVILFTTIDQNGWPHAGMLSYYEIVAKGNSDLLMGLWKDSSSSGNLRNQGKITILVVDKSLIYYVKGLGHLLKEQMMFEPSFSMFHIKVSQVFEDQMLGAPITSGVTFTEIHGPVEKHEEIFKELLDEQLRSD